MQQAIWGLILGTLVASAAPAIETTQRVVFIGDSLTMNPFLLARQMLPERVGRIVGQHFAMQSIAAPGAMMTDYGLVLGFGSQTSLFLVVGGIYPPRAVVILLGTNDYDINGVGVTTDAFRAAYTRFLSSVQSGVPVICVTPPWYANESTPNAGGYTLEDFRAVIRQVCSQQTIVEGSDAIPHDSAYYASGPHPNNLGTQLLARAVGRALKPLLGE